MARSVTIHVGMQRAFIIGAAVATLAVDVDIADACSPPRCVAGSFVPRDGATVPANLPALYWRPGWSYDSTPAVANVTIVNTADPAASLSFTAVALPPDQQPGYALIPDEPLVEGATYLVTDGNLCDSSPGVSVSFHTGPAAALPTDLGELWLVPGARGPLELFTSSGSCTSEVQAARVTARIALTPEAALWEDVLSFETLVDGVRWSRADGDGLGRAADLIYRVCQSDDPGVATGVDAGPHEVAMRATLPGSQLELTTAPLSFELVCGDPGDPDPDQPETIGSDAGCSTSSSPATSWFVLGIVLGLVCRRRRRDAQSSMSEASIRSIA